MDRITIIGLGPIGISIGLALKKPRHKEHRDRRVRRQQGDAEEGPRDGRLRPDDRQTWLKPSRNAQLIIVDTPLDDTRDLLQAVGPTLQPGTVVTETGTAKIQVFEWAKEYLPSGVDLIGSRPLPRRQVSKARGRRRRAIQRLDILHRFGPRRRLENRSRRSQEWRRSSAQSPFSWTHTSTTPMSPR